MAEPTTTSKNCCLTGASSCSNAKPWPTQTACRSAENLIEGDFRETIPGIAAKLGEQAALIHGDIGSGDKADTLALAEWLGPMLQPLAAPGCMIVSDQRLTLAGGDVFPLPGMVADGRYHMLRLQS